MSRAFRHLAFGLGLLALLLGQAAGAQPCREWGELADHGGDESGIGGTGLSDESGIGGTGLGGDEDGVGGTGIYGSITALGSICVNGLRIHTDAAESVRVNGQPAQAADLMPGQLVWVEARARDGVLRARRVAAFSVLAGPVTRVDPVAREIEVAGERVHVAPGAALVDLGGESLGELSRLAPGDVVDVSGLRRPDGRIEATRLARLPGPAPAVAAPTLNELLKRASGLRSVSLEGFLPVLGAGDRLLVDGVAVDLSGVAAAIRDLPPQTRLWLQAEIGADGALRAGRAVPRPLWREPRAAPSLRAPPTTPVFGASDRPDLFDSGSSAKPGDAQPSEPDAGPTPLPTPIDRIAPPPEPPPVDRLEPSTSFEPAGSTTLEPRR